MFVMCISYVLILIMYYIQTMDCIQYICNLLHTYIHTYLLVPVDSQLHFGFFCVGFDGLANLVFGHAMEVVVRHASYNRGGMTGLV